MPFEELSKAARIFLKWGNKPRSTKNKVSESSGLVMQGLRFSNTLEIINTWHQLYRDCLLVAMKWRYVMKHADVYYLIHLMPTYIMRSKVIYLQGSEQFEDAHHHNCLWCKAGQLCEWSRSERKISRATYMPVKELSKAARNVLKWGNKQRSTKQKLVNLLGDQLFKAFQ